MALFLRREKCLLATALTNTHSRSASGEPPSTTACQAVISSMAALLPSQDSTQGTGQSPVSALTGFAIEGQGTMMSECVSRRRAFSTQGFPSSSRWECLQQLFNTIFLMSGFSSNRTLLRAMLPALREPHSPAAAVMNRQSPRWTGAQTNLTNHLRSIQCQSTRPRKRLRNISCHGDKDPGGLVLPFGKQPFMQFLSEQKPNPSFSTKPFKNVYSNTLCQCLK